MAEKKETVWETVPAGTTAEQCTYGKCTDTIYKIRRPSTAKGKEGTIVTVPVHCDVDGGSRPTLTDAGKGVNHWTDCSGAKEKRGAQPGNNNRWKR